MEYLKRKILEYTKINSDTLNNIIDQINKYDIDISFNKKEKYSNIEVTNIINNIKNDVLPSIKLNKIKFLIDNLTTGKKYDLVKNVSIINKCIKNNNIKMKKISQSGKKINT